MAELDYWKRWDQRRASRRQILAAATGGIGMAGLLLAGCASRKRPGSATASPDQAAQGTPKYGGTYNTYLPRDPTNIDPQVVSNTPGEQIARMVMSRPFRFQTGTRSGPHPNLVDDGGIEGDLAVSAESPDAITWTIKLRPDAKFQNIAPVNGHAVEAEDIKATYVRALRIPTNPSRGAMGMIDPNQIQTPDSHTVVFKLNYPYAPFSRTLTSPVYSWIFPREALSGSYDPAKQMIGSGPFLLSSYTPNVEFTLAKNPDWFENGRPYLDGVRVAIITDPSQQLAQFSSGHLDELYVDTKDLATMKAKNPKAVVLPVAPSSGYNIYLQLGDPASPFADERVRQAMSMAIDRDTIHRVVFQDQFEDTHFVPANLGNWALRLSQLDPDTAQYYKFDSTKAKQLLQASGILNQQFKWLYGNTLNPNLDPQNGVLLSMLNAVGFKTGSVEVDYQAVYIDGGKGIRQGFFPTDTIVYGGQQAGFTEVDEFLFSYFHSKSTQNEENIRTPELDAMIDKERTLVNDDERRKSALDIQRYVAKKVYILNAGQAKAFQFVQPRVQNFARDRDKDGAVASYWKMWLTQ